MIALNIIWEDETWRRSGLYGFRTLLQFFADVVRDKVVVRKSVWGWVGVEVIVELKRVECGMG